MELLEREITAIHQLVAKYEDAAYDEALAELKKSGGNNRPEDWDDGSHEYYNWVVLKALLLKLGKI